MTTGTTSTLSLGLAGDGDDTDLLRAVEQAFGVTFGDEPERWRTMGDMHQALLRRLPTSDAPGRCATAMAFHRLRRELQAIPGMPAIQPGTPLRLVMGGASAPAVQARLLQAGFVTPPKVLSWWGVAGLALVAGAAVAAILAGPAWIGLALPGAVLAARDPGRGHLTVGALARDLATCNAGCFMAAGADSRPGAVWAAVAAVVAAETAIPAQSITPATRLLYDG